MYSKEIEEFFHTQLVKYGVDYQRAAQVAHILASGKPDELLSEKEIQIAEEVCREWLRQYKRYKHLTSLLREHKRL
ncbi:MULTISPECIES: hypothetical protein [Fischerella]|jgi:hypothetical protein|uniref:Uncharacterized protein n=3 Tax=Fischerella TaxID=1190 RepID=G6FMJ7_9CYAN|nr:MULTISPECIES: hypothetical protein [Fischerella]PLZ81363.1 hypothetical protein CBP16_10060 [Fischerella thermalis WC217]PMB03458.1 hypothetical protein CI592_14840 [Fischerella thermalis CCMEE 5328]PMB08601.1 hypothetical protein CEN49_09320 [Fischerella thermalis CCMEE 5273]BCX08680.1 MAG: hypothetical protein KatS3mg066_2539 [Fischerella sp.]EHC19277.1 hypothetical protein FJSC11DRAFT_0094 [Fischerella thermalis JSC-11]